MVRKPRSPRGGVTIASGANVPRIDLEALFQDRPAGSHAGVQAIPVTPPARETVILTDGTRITFADAGTALETA